MKKILIVLVIIIFIGGALYFLLNQQQDVWESYTSSSGGFEIKYPSTWSIENTKDASTLRIADSSQSKPDSDQPRDMVLIVKADLACKESAWTVGFGGAYWKTVCIPDSSLSITASAITEKSKTTVDNVLSTLKVTDSTQNIETTKDYSNTEYGFSLTYPKDWHTGSELNMFDGVGYNLNLSFCPSSLFENGNCKYEKTSAQSGKSFAPVLLTVLKNGLDAPKTTQNTTVIVGKKYTYRITLNNSSYKDTYTQIVESFKQN